MAEDVNAADIGQHYLKLEALEILDEDRGKMLRRFVKTFANLHTGENGKIFFGVIKQEAEDD